MITVTSVEAQSRFGELIDRAQREPVEVTRRGRTVAYVVSEQEMQELMSGRNRLQDLSKAQALKASLAAWNDFNARQGSFADEHSTL